jgi:hypothetical protein
MAQVSITNPTKQVMRIATRTSFWGVHETVVQPGAVMTMTAPAAGFDTDQLAATVAALKRHGAVDGTLGPTQKVSYLVF